MSVDNNINDQIKNVENQLIILTDIIKNSVFEDEDYNKLKSYVDDIKIDLFENLDNRINSTFDRRKEFYLEKFSKLEDKILDLYNKIKELNSKDETICSTSRTDHIEIKNEIISHIKELKNDLNKKIEKVDGKLEVHINRHWFDRINYKKTIIPVFLVGISTIILGMIIAIVDKIFGLNLLEFLY